MRFMEYFKPHDEGVGEDDIDAARIIMEFANGLYWPRLRAYFERELGQPVKVSDHVGMIDQAVRRNTLLEVKAKIEREIAAAVETLERNRV